MRNLTLPAIAAASLLLFSCQKEESLERNGTPPPSSPNSVLSKTVVKFGQDSTAVEYEYDSQKRLTASITSGSFQGTSFISKKIIVRNIQGIIQSLKMVSNEGPSADTVVYKVNYDASVSRYTSVVNKQVINGIEYLDSMALVYNAAGKVVKQEYFIDNGTYGGYADFSKSEFAYDGNGNIVKATSYTYDPQSNKHEISYEDVYQYDNKINPVKLNVEAILLGDVSMAGHNNMIKLTATDHSDPSNSEMTTVEYIYNTDNRPKSAKITSQSFGGQVPVAYIYE